MDLDRKSREFEQKHFDETVAFARNVAEITEKKLTDTEKELGEMLRSYDPDNFDLYTEMVATEARRDSLVDLLRRSRRAVGSPYFGRVDFAESGGERHELYIGRSGLNDDRTLTPVVVDWRTPVANLYYDSELGDVSYKSLDKTYCGNMSLKRTYSVQDGKLADFYDSDLVTNDELLQSYLAKNADAVLKDIVATIQKDQNDIIRIEPSYDVIVQGVAGSGKTTVAMHRLAYLLFNYAKASRTDQYAVIGTNRMFLNYVSGMLPELGVESVTQKVMPELLQDYLYYKPEPAPLCAATARERSTSEFFDRLKDYMDELERGILLRDLRLMDELFIGKDSVRELFMGGAKKSIESRVQLLDEYIELQLRGIAPDMEQEIERTSDEAFERFREGDRSLYSSVEELRDDRAARQKRLKKEVRELKNVYIKKVRAMKETTVYREFLASLGMKPGKKRDVYDLAALAYIETRLHPTTGKLRHIIVDEAQDFGPMIYRVLTEIYPNATFTILGDVLQNIGDGVGITDWDEVLGTAFSGRRNKFCVLSKSYRNTVEIAEAANRIAADSGVARYRVEPVVRHGKPVEFARFAHERELWDAACAEASAWEKGSLALVCATGAEAKRLAARIPGAGLITASDPDAIYSGGVTVFDADSVKGLEFDRVVVCGAGEREYPDTPRFARLLYVVMTRALHELRVLTVDGCGGFLEPCGKDNLV